MKDQHSSSNGAEEPVRPGTIPDDFIWDPEYQAWFPPGEPSDFDFEASRRDLDKDIAEGPRGGLITLDELRAAGALDVPPGWRKSLRNEPDLFSNLVDDEEQGEKQ